MNLPSFKSPYIKVDCPDGPRFILKDPVKAFSIIASDWEARIGAVTEAIGDLETHFGLKVAKTLKSLGEALGNSYAELQAHYQAAYLNSRKEANQCTVYFISSHNYNVCCMDFPDTNFL